MVAELLEAAAGGAGDEGRVCAAVAQAESPAPVHLLITEQNGRRSFKVVRSVALGSAIRQASEVGRGTARSDAAGKGTLGPMAPPASASGGNSSMAPYIKAARQYALLSMPLLIAGIFTAWLLKSPVAGPTVGQWYRVKEIRHGQAYELVEIDDASEAGFRFDGEEGGKLILTSRYGEERRLPPGLVSGGTFRRRNRNDNPQASKKEKLNGRDNTDVGSAGEEDQAQRLP
jgi:hypothetical protein